MARKTRTRQEPRFDSNGRNAELRAERREGGQRRTRSAGPRRKKRSRLRFWLSMLKAVAALGIVSAIALAALIGYFALQLPPIDEITVPKRPPNIAIYAEDGSLIANRGATGGEELKLKELPRYIPQAFIATEDQRFYSHFGIDPVGLARAMVTNAMAGSLVQGGSTLTQQLAKNIYLDPSRSIERKGKEAVLALWLERKYSKDQILELYLNRVYFGAGAYGVEAASQRYFGKSARNVNLGEAAILAGLVKAPSKLAPNRNPQGAETRARLVLQMMESEGFITGKDRKNALAMLAADRSYDVDGGRGTARYAADWVVDLLDDYVGNVDSDVIIRTTIAPKVQNAAENALAITLSKRGRKVNVGQGAIVSLAPDGAIRALVGGIDYRASQFNRAVNARRQPGSVFKPFVYLAALEQGQRPDSMIRDEPFRYGNWTPENYRRVYRGDVTLTTALSQSLNIPAAKLGIMVGPRNVMRTAQRLGITSALNDSPSLSLGSAEVTPLEMTAAYTAFANGGIGVIPYVIESIKTKSGKVLYRHQPANLGRVIEPPEVAMMNAMLRETLLTGTARRAALPGWQAAGKTGTSQEFRDAWFIGYTAALTTTVWLGNDDDDPTKRVSGGSLPVEIWSKAMREALSGEAPAPLNTDWRYARTQEVAGEIPQTDDDVGALPEEGPAHLGTVQTEQGTEAPPLDITAPQ
jgi:penicillin-binding protein 1A